MKEGFRLFRGGGVVSVINCARCVPIAAYARVSTHSGDLDSPMVSVLRAVPVHGQPGYDPDWITDDDRALMLAMLADAS